jgi:hypothetical protein
MPSEWLSEMQGNGTAVWRALRAAPSRVVLCACLHAGDRLRTPERSARVRWAARGLAPARARSRLRALAAAALLPALPSMTGPCLPGRRCYCRVCSAWRVHAGDLASRVRQGTQQHQRLSSARIGSLHPPPSHLRMRVWRACASLWHPRSRARAPTCARAHWRTQAWAGSRLSPMLPARAHACARCRVWRAHA